MSRRRNDCKEPLTEEQLAAARKARAEWSRKYRQENPNANKEAIARYWLKKAGQMQQE